MTRSELYDYLQRNRLGVLATVADDGSPRAAAMGFAVLPDLQMLFDTLRSSRKHACLLREPRVAVTVWDGATTVQYEGLARELGGQELLLLQPRYLAAFPDGHQRLSSPDLTYFAIRPTWVRFADYGVAPPQLQNIAI